MDENRCFISLGKNRGFVSQSFHENRIILFRNSLTKIVEFFCDRLAKIGVWFCDLLKIMAVSFHDRLRKIAFGFHDHLTEIVVLLWDCLTEIVVFWRLFGENRNSGSFGKNHCFVLRSFSVNWSLIAWSFDENYCLTLQSFEEDRFLISHLFDKDRSFILDHLTKIAVSFCHFVLGPSGEIFILILLLKFFCLLKIIFFHMINW